jgi:hypothetical protein
MLYGLKNYFKNDFGATKIDKIICILVKISKFRNLKIV